MTLVLGMQLRRMLGVASMRPRLIAVDDSTAVRPERRSMYRFNEATADRRG